MAVRFLLDENLEHEVLHRLETFGYDVAHVEFHPDLGKGTDDAPIAEFSLRNRWVVVTYDPDFVKEHTESDFFGTVYFDADDLSARDVADILQTMAETYPESEFERLQFGGREWL